MSGEAAAVEDLENIEGRPAVPVVINNTGAELELRELPPDAGERLGLTAAKLQEQIDKHIAEAQALKPDARGVVVAVADLQGAELATYFRLPINGEMVWSLGAFVRKEWKGEYEAGVSTRLVF